MRALLLAILLVTAGCSDPSRDVREVARFAAAVEEAECPTAECAARAEEDERFMEIVTQ